MVNRFDALNLLFSLHQVQLVETKLKFMAEFKLLVEFLKNFTFIIVEISYQIIYYKYNIY
jgi:hypothetical protein